MRNQELEYICKLIFESFKAPVTLLDVNGKLTLELSSMTESHPVWPNKVRLFEGLFSSDEPVDFPVLRTTNLLENYFSVRFHNGTIVVGPCLYAHLTEDSISRLMHDSQIPIKQRDALLYYRALPVISRIQFLHASMMLYYLIYGKPLDVTEVIQKNTTLQLSTRITEQVDIQLSVLRDHAAKHHDPLQEENLMRCIREGNKAALLKYLNGFPFEEAGILSKKSELRSEKNLAICGITLATRAAIEGGLHPEVAYTMSDLYIQNLEEMTEVRDVTLLMNDALCEIADRVSKSHDQGYSKPVTTCKHYIFDHIYEEIRIADLANLVNLHPVYLSQRFKKEVGIPLTEYIQRERVEEAKKLLTLSGLTLSDVCSRLNFNDQSYFTKVFKKFTGMTPKQFKTKTHILGSA